MLAKLQFSGQVKYPTNVGILSQGHIAVYMICCYIRNLNMNTSRLAAFSDGLFAVVITIMVLELNAPIGTNISSLTPLLPVFLSYVLSFIYGAIFWINHHHLLAVTRKINSTVLWANLNFLFWLSLIPFFTAWVDENHAASMPVAAYGMSLFMVVASYRLLELVLFRVHDADALLVRILRPGRREKASLVAFAIAIPTAFIWPFISLGIYIFVAAMWFMPERALERALARRDICDTK